MSKPLPDSPEANGLGCSCPTTPNGGFSNRGAGTLIDGVREWTVNPTCPIHAKPSWWYSRRLPRP